MINTINNKVFRNANEAYEYVHDKILQEGVEFGDTKTLFNVCKKPLVIELMKNLIMNLNLITQI